MACHTHHFCRSLAESLQRSRPCSRPVAITAAAVAAGVGLGILARNRLLRFCLRSDSAGQRHGRKWVLSCSAGRVELSLPELLQEEPPESLRVARLLALSLLLSQQQRSALECGRAAVKDEHRPDAMEQKLNNPAESSEEVSVRNSMPVPVSHCCEQGCWRGWGACARTSDRGRSYRVKS